MPNLTTMVGSGTTPAVFEATTTTQICQIEPDRAITLAHDGETSAGTSSSVTIYFSFDGEIDPDPSPNGNKVKLINARSIAIGPGKRAMYFQSASGTCTFSAVPSERFYGHY